MNHDGCLLKSFSKWSKKICMEACLTLDLQYFVLNLCI